MIFDSHTHIFLEEFDEDRTGVVERALAAGVSRVMLPNVDVDTLERLVATVEAYPHFCDMAVGLHPTSVGGDWEQQLKIVEEHLREKWLHYPQLKAIGEVGLDLYWDTSYQAEQEQVLTRQMAWARELQLPLIIHQRSAHEPLMHLFREQHAEELSGVFHSFTGTHEELQELLTFPRFMVGINGIVTFKRAAIAEVVPAIPLDRLLVETDAPYLAPVPYRGKRNEPAYARDTLQFMATLLDMPIEELAEITANNYQHLFLSRE